jgi:hypothetical protein
MTTAYPSAEQPDGAGWGHLVIDGRMTVQLASYGVMLGRKSQRDIRVRRRRGKPLELIQIGVAERDERAAFLSAMHCSIERDATGDVWLVREKECRNGIWVNGALVEPQGSVRLTDGDEFHLVKEALPICKALVCTFHLGEAQPTAALDGGGRQTTEQACNRDFLCPVCMEAMVSAVQLRPCGHSTCPRCISRILSMGSQASKCPKGCGPIVEVVENQDARAEVARRIEAQHVCCDNGCGEDVLVAPADAGHLQCVPGFQVPGKVADMKGAVPESEDPPYSPPQKHTHA